MKGLRFYRKSITTKDENGLLCFYHGEIEPGRSDFDYIFRSIYEDLNDLYMLNDQLPVFDQDFEHEIYNEYKIFIIQDNEDYLVTKPGILNHCGNEMPEFDGNLLIFVKEVPAQMSWREYYTFERTWSKNTICTLSNSDGIFWEIYTDRTFLIEKLISCHSGDKNLEVFHVDSEIDYPDTTRSKEQLTHA